MLRTMAAPFPMNFQGIIVLFWSCLEQGEGVEIWVVDSGINPTHDDFGGRASIALDVYGKNVSCTS